MKEKTSFCISNPIKLLTLIKNAHVISYRREVKDLIEDLEENRIEAQELMSLNKEQYIDKIIEELKEGLKENQKYQDDFLKEHILPVISFIAKACCCLVLGYFIIYLVILPAVNWINDETKIQDEMNKASQPIPLYKELVANNCYIRYFVFSSSVYCDNLAEKIEGAIKPDLNKLSKLSEEDRKDIYIQLQKQLAIEKLK